MSPNGQQRPNVAPANNIYTVLLGFAFLALLAAGAFVMFTIYSRYGTFFNIP